MNLPQTTAKKITDLKIQGAKAIATASLNCLKSYADKIKNKPAKIFVKQIKQAILKLKKSRPTEPLNQNFLNYLAGQSASPKNLLAGINRLSTLLAKAEAATIKNGSKIIKAKQNIFTHCHSSTVEAILKTAKKRGKKFSVYNTETRPKFQGRITGKKLARAGIKVTTLVDSAAAYTVSDKSGDKIKINLVFLGADAILPNGGVINKIGSFGIALTARDSKIPVYAVTELLKFTANKKLPLEIRPANEIWRHKPKNLKIINFAFDVVPARLLTRIICEFGIIKPSQVKNLVKKHYPWILK